MLRRLHHRDQALFSELFLLRAHRFADPVSEGDQQVVLLQRHTALFVAAHRQQPDDRDDVDFAQTWPLLAADARRWLHDALELTAPDRKWIAVLRGAATRAAT